MSNVKNGIKPADASGNVTPRALGRNTATAVNTTGGGQNSGDLSNMTQQSVKSFKRTRLSSGIRKSSGEGPRKWGAGHSVNDSINSSAERKPGVDSFSIGRGSDSGQRMAK